MGKRYKTLITFLLIIVLITAISPAALAVVPYKTYNYNSYGEAVKSANIYEPSEVINGESLNIGSFSTPGDVFVKGDTLYILDSGNSRIVLYNMVTKSARETQIKYNSDYADLSKAAGIYVDANNTVYVADSGNQCVWIANSKGEAEEKILKPQTEYFEEALEFLPRKVVGDSVGNIYVQCTGVYEGLVIFSPEHKFSGFFGSEKVQTTADILRNYFWKQFMTSEQKDAMSNYVPSEIYSMDMNSENFLYTITPGKLIGNNYFKETPDSIRCLNPKGSDVLNCSMSADVKRSFENDNRYLNFIDISYTESGFIDVIDNKQGRVYQFDNNMQLITAFGGLGNYAGTFKRPVAVENFGDDIIVLDSEKNDITFFSLTEAGTVVHKALGLYNSGNYSESYEYWCQVIKANPNFQLAYVGAGNAMFNECEYEKAMNYYEIARDTAGYGNAYREYRVSLMRSNFIWFIIAIVLIFVMVTAVKRSLAKREISIAQKVYSGNFGMTLYSAFHPVIGFDRLRSKKIFSKSFTAVIFLFLVLLGVCEQQYMGKSFSIVDTSGINIINIALVRLALLVLFIASNWAFSELMTGKATLKQICTLTSAALVPYIISGFIRVALSHILVQNEEVFMTVILIIGIMCSFAILMLGFSVFHEFELGKALFSFFVTVIGMLLIVVLAFLFYNLTQNVIDFIKTVFSETVFRMNT